MLERTRSRGHRDFRRERAGRLGRRALRGYLGRGQTLVLLGSSGAGKSTLTNTLLGAAVQDTGAVRVNDGRGKHTTTARSLHRLPGGACVIDTPGLRTLRPDADEATLAAVYDDIETLAAQCRFRDCRHAQEPGCAVREGIGADRLRNYHKLLRETRRDTLTALDRQRPARRMERAGTRSEDADESEARRMSAAGQSRARRSPLSRRRGNQSPDRHQNTAMAGSWRAVLRPCPCCGGPLMRIAAPARSTGCCRIVASHASLSVHRARMRLAGQSVASAPR